MKTLDLRRVTGALVAWAVLLALSPAPINAGPAKTIEREKTDSVRSLEQNGVRLGEVGSTPNIDQPQGEIPPIEYSETGQHNVASASTKQKAKGEDIIKQASEDLKKPKSGGFNWLGAILVLCGAFGLFQVFRVWANKNLPEPGQFK